MNKLTGQEILKIIEDTEASIEEFAYGDFKSDGVGEWTEVSQKGGEGQGEEWYSVKYFKDHDVYIRTDGFYSSYDGTYFDDGYGKEVKPTQRVVTFYE